MPRSSGPFSVRASASTTIAALAFGVAMPALAHDAPPLAYQLLCLRSPADCHGGGASSVEASEGLLATLTRVNTQINHAGVSREDIGADVWNADADGGDCEDYALAKRRALVSAGLPASALRFVLVRTPSGESHVVLVVATNAGELALDNLTDEIRPLSETGYKVETKLQLEK